jgi:methylthioribose-1-phosphate isomerase
MRQDFDSVRPIRWHDDKLQLLDQRQLPDRCEFLSYSSSDAVAEAIRTMVVRGAPAIGIAAAYAVVLAVARRYAESPDGWLEAVGPDLQRLRSARPTAVNLSWAVDRMWRCGQALAQDPVPRMLAEAQAIHHQDLQANRRLGELGARLLEPRSALLTHCNAGALATGGYGTALGVVRSAFAAGRVRRVYADETRPWLQGSRLTAWELLQDGIPVTLLADGACAWLMRSGEVDWVVVGADRIAANGDVANKIGTYGVAVAARHHGARFMVAAPTSTIDLATPRGEDIPIEQRAPGELLSVAGQRVAAQGAQVWNPVFDVTPASLVDAIVTENGVVEKPDAKGIRRMMHRDATRG